MGRGCQATRAAIRTSITRTPYGCRTPGERQGPAVRGAPMRSSAAAAWAQHHAGADQREADAGENEKQRAAREDQRQGLVDVAHDRALWLDHLDGGGRI